MDDGARLAVLLEASGRAYRLLGLSRGVERGRERDVENFFFLLFSTRVARRLITCVAVSSPRERSMRQPAVKISPPDTFFSSSLGLILFSRSAKMPKPIAQPVKKIKKHPKQFRRYQADLFKRIQNSSWRKPKGIDSKVRRRYRGFDRSPKIGYGTRASQRHLLPNGFKKFRVFNVAELDVLLMQHREYCAEIASSVGARKRIAIVERAKQLDIKLLNGKAKVRAVQHE